MNVNTLELKAARTRFGYTQADMARMLDCNVMTYLRKENGQRDFSDAEKIKISSFLQLDLPAVNAIFFDGKLPAGRTCDR